MKKAIIITILFVGGFLLAGSVQAAEFTTVAGAPIYGEGKINQALTVDSNTLMNFDYSSSAGFNSTAGSVELWVKPVDWNTDSAGYWELLNVTNSIGDVFEFRRGKDATHNNLQFIAYSATGGFKAWKSPDAKLFSWTNGTWYHLAVTWDASSSPTFYVNGTAYPAVPAYSETTWTPKTAETGTVTIGQRKNQFPDSSWGGFNNAGRAAFDEVRVSNAKRSADEISLSYNSGDGKLLAVDVSTLWIAHFDSSTTLVLPDVDEDVDEPVPTRCGLAASASDTAHYGPGLLYSALDVKNNKPLINYYCTSGTILDPNQGTVEFWFRPSGEWNSVFWGYHHLVSFVDQGGDDRLLIRHGQDANWNNLQAIFYREDGSFQAWSGGDTERLDRNWDHNRWYHVALTWSKANKPQFYLDGKAISMRASYGATTWEMAAITEGKAYVGSRVSNLDRNTSADADALIDELRVSDGPRSAAEVSLSYNGGKGAELLLDIHSLWLTHFNNTLVNGTDVMKLQQNIKAAPLILDENPNVDLVLKNFLATSATATIGKINATVEIDPGVGLTVTFDKTKLQPGIYDVILIINGRRYVLKGAVTILGYPPTVTTPILKFPSNKQKAMYLMGTNFANGAKVTIIKNGKNYAVTNLVRRSDKRLEYVLPKLIRGWYDIQVTNPDGQKILKKGNLQII